MRRLSLALTMSCSYARASIQSTRVLLAPEASASEPQNMPGPLNRDDRATGEEQLAKGHTGEASDVRGATPPPPISREHLREPERDHRSSSRSKPSDERPVG